MPPFFVGKGTCATCFTSSFASKLGLAEGKFCSRARGGENGRPFKSGRSEGADHPKFLLLKKKPDLLVRPGLKS